MGDSDDPTRDQTLATDTGRVLGSLVGLDSPGLAVALKELNIDAETIATILKTLNSGQESLKKGEHVRGVASHSFGYLPKSAELAGEAGKAHEYLRAAVTEMLQTLDLYVDGVRAFRDGQTATDDYSAQQLQRINHTVAGARRHNDQGA